MAETIVLGGGRWTAPNENWWEVEDDCVADVVMDQVRYTEYRQASIHEGHRRHAELVLGYVPISFSWSPTQGSTRPPVQATKNVCRSIVDTASALIAKTLPKPTVVTDGADYEVATRATDLDRFLVGAYSRANTYPVAQSAFRDSTIFGTGCWRLVEHGSGDDFWVENVRINPDDLVVNEEDLNENGYPCNVYLRTVVSLDKAIKRWAVGKRAKEIEQGLRDAAGKNVMWPKNRPVPANRVVICEAWHPADQDGSDGHYVAAADGVMLDRSDWDFDWAPFVFLFWSPPISGFYGDGVAYRQAGRQRRINYLYRWVQRCQDLIASPRVWVDATNGPLKVQISNEIGEIVSHRGRPPEFQMPQAVSAELYSWLDALERGGYEDEGISQFSAQNQLPKGIESAPAQREYSFKEGSRFALVSQRWEDAVARENAYKTLALYKRAFEGGASPRVAWANRTLAETIHWEDVDMETDRYQIRVEASSLESLSPAGRLQAVIELAQTGWIEPGEGRQLLGHPDLAKSQDEDTAAEDYGDFVVRQLLKGNFVPPNPYADLKVCLRKVKAACLRAEMGEAPRSIVKNLIDYMRAVDSLLAPPPAPLGAMPGAAPGTGPVPLPGNIGPSSVQVPPAGSGMPMQTLNPYAAYGKMPLPGAE